MSKMKPAKEWQAGNLGDALRYLRSARAMLELAECPKTLNRVRAAVKSAEGAMRHMERRLRAIS